MKFKMEVEQIEEIIQTLEQIESDLSVPKNVRTRVKNAMEVLKTTSNVNMAVNINKSLQELDELHDNANIPTYTRTMIWNVVSSLESIK